MLKIGDILLCKKSIKDFVETGVYYRINNTSFVDDDYELSIFVISNLWFNLSNNNEFYLYDYFYTKQEERIIKLKKINEKLNEKQRVYNNNLFGEF